MKELPTWVIDWAKALKSGKYKKGTGALLHLRDNSYCCLGVLCDLEGRDPQVFGSVDDGLDEGPQDIYEELKEKINVLLSNESVWDAITAKLISVNDNGPRANLDFNDVVEVMIKNLRTEYDVTELEKL